MFMPLTTVNEISSPQNIPHILSEVNYSPTRISRGGSVSRGSIAQNRWAGHVARMGEERGRIGSWW